MRIAKMSTLFILAELGTGSVAQREGARADLSRERGIQCRYATEKEQENIWGIYEQMSRKFFVVKGHVADIYQRVIERPECVRNR
jgi:hypothetical protein